MDPLQWMGAISTGESNIIVTVHTGIQERGDEDRNKQGI